MRLLLLIAITAMATFSLIAADLGAPGRVSMNTQGGERALTITIKPGAALDGKIQAGEYEASIDNGKISG